MKTLIMIAALNVEATILQTIATLKKEVPDVDILVIDRKSSDQTLKLLRDQHIEHLSTPLPTNYYDAISLGLMYSHNYNYDLAIEFDDQNLFLIKDILYLLRVMDYQKTDFVFASRYANYYHANWGASSLRLITRIKTKHQMSDPTVRFKIYGTKAIEFFGTRMTLNKPTPDEIINLINKKGYTFKEAFVKPTQQATKVNRQHRKVTCGQTFSWIMTILLINPWRFKKAHSTKTHL